MANDRLDDLLDAALDTGAVPPEANAAQRAELELLLANARVLTAAAARAQSEAAAAMPVARARFERFLDTQQRTATPISPPAAPAKRRAFLGGVFAAHRALSLGAAAVLVVGVVLAAVGSQMFFGGAETAAALVPGDFAQVSGVVTSVSGESDTRTVHVATDVGDLDIAVDADTSVVDDQAATDASAITPGTRVVVAGTVLDKRKIAARTLALSAGLVSARPAAVTLKELKALRSGLSGSVVSISLAPNGVRARVVIETASGERYLVIVNAKSAERLLALQRSLGARVRVTAMAAGLFTLEVDQPASPPDATPAAGDTPARATPTSAATSVASTLTPVAAPTLPAVQGVITARVANVLTVQTAGDAVQVVITADTRILFSESGLTLAAIRTGETVIGHSVQVQGGLERRNGRLVADTIVVGPKASR
jgi:hypothetical protein